MGTRRSWSNCGVIQYKATVVDKRAHAFPVVEQLTLARFPQDRGSAPTARSASRVGVLACLDRILGMRRQDSGTGGGAAAGSRRPKARKTDERATKSDLPDQLVEQSAESEGTTARPWAEPDMRLALNRATLNPEAPPSRAIRAALEGGFGWVELSAGKLKQAIEHDPALREILGPQGIVPVHGGWNIRLHWPKERLSAALRDTPRAMEFAASLGSRSGTLVLPRTEPGGEPIPGPAELVDRIGRIADLAWGSSGLDVMLEFIGLRPADPVECGVRTLEETLDVVRSVGRRNVGVLLDSFHCHASGLKDLTRIPPKTPMFIHLNDAPPVPVTQLTDRHRLLPGQGVIDLIGLLKGARRWGYDGPVSVELKNPALHAMPLGQAARAAFDAARAVLAAAGEDPV